MVPPWHYNTLSFRARRPHQAYVLSSQTYSLRSPNHHCHRKCLCSRPYTCGAGLSEPFIFRNVIKSIIYYDTDVCGTCCTLIASLLFACTVVSHVQRRTASSVAPCPFFLLVTQSCASTLYPLGPSLRMLPRRLIESCRRPTS